MCPAMIVIADKTVYIRKGNSLCMWIIYLLVLNGGITSMLCILHELWCGIICLPIGFRRMRIVCYPRVFFSFLTPVVFSLWMNVPSFGFCDKHVIFFLFGYINEDRECNVYIYIYVYMYLNVFTCLYVSCCIFNIFPFVLLVLFSKIIFP